MCGVCILRGLKVLPVASKKFTSLNCRTGQNQFIRTNHSRRAFLVSTPVGNSPPDLRPPCLCALCVEFPFPASVFIATLAQEGRLVAQGAASFAGPEAFSYRIIRRTNSMRLTPVECALTQKYRGGVGAHRGHSLRCHYDRRAVDPTRGDVARGGWGAHRLRSPGCHSRAPSSRERHGHQELSRVNKGRGICFWFSLGRHREIAFGGRTS